jgi:hypothetical protein
MDPTVVSSVVIIVGAPILSSLGVSFLFIGNIFSRLLLLAYALYCVSRGPMPALLGFLAVFSLVVERNQEMITKLPYQAPGRLNKRPTTPFVHSAVAPTVTNKATTFSVFDAPFNREKADASDLEDNIPDLEEGPRAKDAVAFYSAKGFSATP